MDVLLPAALALGVVSGFKHAFEPDHVVAVSALLHRDVRLRSALRTGLAWGAGHTTMLMAGVLVAGGLRLQVAESQLAYFELPVALLLLGVGAWVLVDLANRVRHLRRHEHDGVPHTHAGPYPHPHGFAWRRTGWQGYAVGLVHGMAGSGALMLLVAATLPSMAASIAYALLFGAGSVVGMGAVTLVLGSTLRASRRRPAVFHTLTGLSGTLSIVLGGSILYAFL